jgi:hypothetical protein
MKMTNDQYVSYKHRVRDWKGTKEGLQRLYDEIYYTFEDAPEWLPEIDKQQTSWVMNLHN